MMTFNFNNNIIGYSYEQEAKTICEIISEVDCNDILDVGCFTGKLTWALCKTFNHKKIIALDIWDSYMDKLLDPRVNINGNDINLFNSFNSEHNNLLTIRENFFNYNKSHDIIILGLDYSSLEWNKLFKHTISLNPKLIIGRHAYHEQEKRKNMISIIKTYNHKFFKNGVYTIND